MALQDNSTAIAEALALLNSGAVSTSVGDMSISIDTALLSRRLNELRLRDAASVTAKRVRPRNFSVCLSSFQP